MKILLIGAGGNTGLGIPGIFRPYISQLINKKEQHEKSDHCYFGIGISIFINGTNE